MELPRGIVKADNPTSIMIGGMCAPQSSLQGGIFTLQGIAETADRCTTIPIAMGQERCPHHGSWMTPRGTPAGCATWTMTGPVYMQRACPQQIFSPRWERTLGLLPPPPPLSPPEPPALPPFPHAPPLFPAFSVCTESCRHNADGYCDDGGCSSSQYDACEYGSDCTACGHRAPCPPRPPQEQQAPPQPYPLFIELSGLCPSLLGYGQLYSLQGCGRSAGHWRPRDYVQESDVMLLFLSQGYFLSRNCLREVDATLKFKKPYIFVHKADASKGGAPLHVLQLELKDVDQRNELFDGRDDDVIVWHRIQAFQMVSLLLIVKQMLRHSLQYRDRPALPVYISQAPCWRNGSRRRALTNSARGDSSGAQDAAVVELSSL
eukprot:6149917-Prymnesium_polylepis.1